MKSLVVLLSLLSAFVTPALATVTVTSPANNSTVSSPVQFTATATTTCSKGVSAMGVYANNQRVVVQNGAKLNASVPLANGSYYTVVQEWDGCGGSTTAPVRITVQSSTSATTVQVTGSPTSITAGGSSVLSVSASNATNVTLSGGGASYNLPTTGGSLTVKPTTTTTYTASATGGSGTVSSTATVTVTPAGSTAPTVSVSANPASITSGQSSNLTVSATNATQVTLSGSDGSSYSLSPSGGQQTVTPTANTTYTARATGSSGTVSTAQTSLTVAPAGTTGVTVSTPANNSTVTSPVHYAATATTTCSKGVSAMGIYVNGQRIVVQNGASLNANVSLANGSYKTVVQEWDGCGGSKTATIYITVQSTAATSVNMTASPTSITSGSSSVLTVSAANATTVSVTGGGTTYNLPTSGGQLTVSPTVTTTYTATATGASGSAVTSTAAVTVASASAPTVNLTANPTSITSGSSSTLTVTATNATHVTLAGGGTSYNLSNTGGTQSVSPTATTTYTATATGSSGSVSSTATVTVTGSGSGGPAVNPIDHVIFMLQENHSFDNYFGMLNPYRRNNGWNVGGDGQTYDVDGIDGKLSKITNDSDEGTVYGPFKLKSTCVDDMSSAFLESYGDVNRYDFSTTRKYGMDGFVHTAEGFAKSCSQANSGCQGAFTDLNGQRAMGYYDEGFLNYYYYMASQFALSDRWFSPVSSKTISNRLATFTGGTTQGLVADPGSNDHLPQLSIQTIFQELDQAKVSWKIYYITTQGGCLAGSTCSGTAAAYPDTAFDFFTYAHNYIYKNPNHYACTAPTQPSSVVGDTSNDFCIDPTRIAPLSTYYSDLTNSTLPSFAFIEAGSGRDDEHPGSGQSVLNGQVQIAQIANAFMTSPSWNHSAFFMAYDEGGGPFDHVPPVPGHSNQNTDSTVGSAAIGSIPDISSIAVNADSYGPCVAPGGVPSLHCDLPNTSFPGGHSTDAAAQQGFAAQLGFRVPNMVISPFTRKHYVSHIPMDHTAILKFVENRFIGPSAHLTARDAAQPDLLNFFDFTAIPWSTPPTPPAPVTPTSLGYDPCTPQTF